MKTMLAAVLAASTLFCLTDASAQVTPDLERADAIAEAARVTSTRLRRRWDEARKQHATAALCLQDKVAQAVVLAKTVDERCATLRSTADPSERTRLSRRLEALEERRVALEGEALRCK